MSTSGKGKHIHRKKGDGPLRVAVIEEGLLPLPFRKRGEGGKGKKN